MGGHPGGGLDIWSVMPTDTSLLVRGGQTGRGLTRLQLLETYLQTLLLVNHVSRAPALTSFFAPQPWDLESTLPPGRCLTVPNSPWEVSGGWRWHSGERA